MLIHQGNGHIIYSHYDTVVAKSRSCLSSLKDSNFSRLINLVLMNHRDMAVFSLMEVDLVDPVLQYFALMIMIRPRVMHLKRRTVAELRLPALFFALR